MVDNGALLWMAGLLTVAVVGAVSFMEFGSSEDGADSEDEADLPDMDSSELFIPPFPESGQAVEPLETDQALDPTELAMEDMQEDEEGLASNADLEAPQILMGEKWSTPSDVTMIDEFDPVEDDLVLIWDDMDDPQEEPELSLATSMSSPDMISVMLNGAAVAMIPARSSITANRVSLIPLSAAKEIGW